MKLRALLFVIGASLVSGLSAYTFLEKRVVEIAAIEN